MIMQNLVQNPNDAGQTQVAQRFQQRIQADGHIHVEVLGVQINESIVRNMS